MLDDKEIRPWAIYLTSLRSSVNGFIVPMQGYLLIHSAIIYINQHKLFVYSIELDTIFALD